MKSEKHSTTHWEKGGLVGGGRQKKSGGKETFCDLSQFASAARLLRQNNEKSQFVIVSRGKKCKIKLFQICLLMRGN
jgi:hypothetical protein